MGWRMADVSDDLKLLRQYAQTASEAVFATLVDRHVGMVYAAALRQARSRDAAEEITQAVFILLMRKAGSMPDGTVLAAWLFKATRYTALNAGRAQARRRRHERKAAWMKSQSSEPTAAWADVRPLLDSAVAALGPKDRAAVILRYFERRSLAEVGEALGVSENAAQMRVSRAVEKLREFFGRRGVALTATGIALLLATNAAEAAPAGVAGGLSVSALKSARVKSAMSLAGRVSREMVLRQVGRVAAMLVATVLILGGLGMASVLVLRPAQPPTDAKTETASASSPETTTRLWPFR